MELQEAQAPSTDLWCLKQQWDLRLKEITLNSNQGSSENTFPGRTFFSWEYSCGKNILQISKHNQNNIISLSLLSFFLYLPNSFGWLID
jgi:hypothetical protein